MAKIRVNWLLAKGGQILWGDTVFNPCLGSHTVSSSFDVDAVVHHGNATYVTGLAYRTGRHIGRLRNVCTPVGPSILCNFAPDMELLATLQNLSDNIEK